MKNTFKKALATGLALALSFGSVALATRSDADIKADFDRISQEIKTAQENKKTLYEATETAKQNDKVAEARLKEGEEALATAEKTLK